MYIESNMKRLLFIVLVLLLGSVLYSEEINDIFTKFINSNDQELSKYLINKGFETYEVPGNNGNLYFHPIDGKNITFYDMQLNTIVVSYNSLFNVLNVSVKGRNNYFKGRDVVNLIVRTYGFNQESQDSYKKGKYRFSYYEYIDPDYGYLSYQFSDWNK